MCGKELAAYEIARRLVGSEVYIWVSEGGERKERCKWVGRTHGTMYVGW